MTFIFYILSALLIFLSYKSLRGGVAYLNFFKSELAKPESVFTPMASLIVPCRGVDEGLEKNLSMVVRQDYPAYEVIFVVDDEADPAVDVIKEISRKASKNAKTRLVIADRATDSSQKVENLRDAVQHISGESKIIAFVDSDARSNESWLRHLIAPLENESIGAATGYRWFISEKPTSSTELLSVWNASIASALGPNMKSNFCWGGSMAIRREIFENLEVRENWRGTLSDDFTMTRVLNEANLPICFVPQALAVSAGARTFADLLEFTMRQMKIAHVYAPKLWLMTFFGSGLFILVLQCSLLIIIFSRKNDITVLAAIVTLALVAFFSIGKSWLRLRAVKLVMPEHKKALKRQFWAQVTLWAIATPLFFFNSAAALLSRKMTWRGISYNMISPDETEILKTEAKQAR